MSEKSTSVSLSPGWLGLLGVILVVGKLTGHIQVSWFWATLPFWVGFAVLLVIIAVGALGFGGFLGVAALYDKWNARNRRRQVKR